MPASGYFNDRTKILIGDSGTEVLAAAGVAVYGLGGVGAALAMDLVRAGVGRLYVVDFDIVDVSNLNRLYFGFASTVGMPKTEAFSRFAREINPDVAIESRQIFFSGEGAHEIVDGASDIHADCVDSLNAKVNLIAELCARRCDFIASMGTAGRLAPERLRIGSVWKTEGCPLAKSVRTRLRHMGVEADFPVVWSDEPPVKPVHPDGVLAAGGQRAPDAAPWVGSGENEAPGAASGASPAPGRRRMVQGSSPFVPQVAGHIMASWIVRRLLSTHLAAKEAD
ncbi:MAG: ThiF family adenylyltransferase [Spirochaetales bacterium]|jgi:tRNA A37 threonylcarbamoyladenosine dehydratase